MRDLKYDLIWFQTEKLEPKKRTRTDFLDRSDIYVIWSDVMDIANVV